MASTWPPRALKVVQAPVDADPSTVVLSSKLAEELTLPRGGYVLVRGKLGRSMVCVVSVNDGLESNKIGLSGTELENLKVALGGTVTLAPTGGLARARTVVVHPLAETVEGVTEDLLATYLGPYFQGIPPVTVGTTFLLRRGRRPVEFAILDLASSQGDSLHHGIATVDTQVRCMEPLRRGEIQDPEDVGFHDVGGYKDAVDRLKELVEVPLRHPDLFKELGAPPPRAVLIQGPPGCGKTLAARAAAREAEAGLVRLHGAVTLAAYLRSTKDGEMELREAFKLAKQSAPTVILFEKLDIIAPECGNTHIETKHLIVAHLLQLLREIKEGVLVIGTSSQDLGESLQRCGGFDSEVILPLPEEIGRREILETKTRNLKLAPDVKLGLLASYTQGLSGAELELLCKKAAWVCAMRTADGADKRVQASSIAAAAVNQADFQQALTELGERFAQLQMVDPMLMQQQQVTAAAAQEGSMNMPRGGGRGHLAKMRMAGAMGGTHADPRLQEPEMMQQVMSSRGAAPLQDDFVAGQHLAVPGQQGSQRRQFGLGKMRMAGALGHGQIDQRQLHPAEIMQEPMSQQYPPEGMQQQMNQTYSQRPQQQMNQMYSQRPQEQMSQTFSQRPQEQMGPAYSLRPQEQMGPAYSQRPQEQMSQRFSQMPQEQMSQTKSQRPPGQGNRSLRQQVADEDLAMAEQERGGRQRPPLKGGYAKSRGNGKARQQDPVDEISASGGSGSVSGIESVQAAGGPFGAGSDTFDPGREPPNF